MKNMNWRCTRHTPGKLPKSYYLEKVGDKVLEFIRDEDTYTLNRVYVERGLIVVVPVPCLMHEETKFKDVDMKIEISTKAICGTYPVYFKGGERVERP